MSKTPIEKQIAVKARSECGESIRSIAKDSSIDLCRSTISSIAKNDQLSVEHRPQIDQLKSDLQRSMLEQSRDLVSLNDDLVKSLKGRDYDREKPEVVASVLRSSSISAGIAVQKATTELDSQRENAPSISLYLNTGDIHNVQGLPTINPTEARNLAIERTKREREDRERDPTNP
tara:strand:- start:1757 stop:2281 length:525 start_codon:yes stop_codon:yes gene_type:complete